MPGAVPDLPAEIQYRGLKAVSKKGGTDTVYQAGLLGEGYGGVGEGFVQLTEDDTHSYLCGRMPEVLDLLNGSAVIAYLDNAYKKPWFDKIGDQFGRTIEAVWVDEPHFRPQLLPWSLKLPEAFRAQFGYDLIPHLPSLFFEKGDWQKVRHHYWRTVVDLFMSSYFAHVGQWCAVHQVKFAGHLMGEDSLRDQIAWTGSTMQAYEHMQLPGIDHLTLDLNWPLGKKFILTPKQATSVANQLGKAEVLAEMYAVSSHRITFRERRRIFNWLAVLGISYRCLHAAYYSMRGLRKRIYVPHLGFQQPWWRENRLVADYAARASWFLQQGYRHADVLVIHPQESAYCLYDPQSNQRSAERSASSCVLDERNDRLIDLCATLLSLQRDFEFGDEALLAKHASLDGTAVRVGRIRYRIVVLPDLITIRNTTLKLLNNFIAAGGTVLAAGTLPERVDGVAFRELAADVKKQYSTLLEKVKKTSPDSRTLAAALDAAVPRQFVLSGGPEVQHVWVHQRVLDKRIGLFIVNTSPDLAIKAGLRLNFCGAVEVWDLETGAISPAAVQVQHHHMMLPLNLAPDGALLLMVDTARPAQKASSSTWQEVSTVSLTDTPRVRRLWPNALPLDIARYRKGDGPWSALLPTVTIQAAMEKEQYHGPLTVEYMFEVADVPPQAQVAIETPELYAVTVNGQPIPMPSKSAEYYIDPSCRLLDISPALRPGVNTVRLTGIFRAKPKGVGGLRSLYEVRDGSEIEAVYILGDFAVVGEFTSKPGGRCLTYASRRIAFEPAHAGWQLAQHGYPFFAGRLVLADTVELTAPDQNEKVFLRLPDLHAPVARVRVNAKDAGVVAWPPLEVEITAMIKPGGNEIELELASSLRNALGPFHRALGEPDSCWGNAWNDLRGAKGLEHEDEYSDWTDNYNVIPFGCSQAPQVVVRRMVKSAETCG